MGHKGIARYTGTETKVTTDEIKDAIWKNIIMLSANGFVYRVYHIFNVHTPNKLTKEKESKQIRQNQWDLLLLNRHYSLIDSYIKAGDI